MLSLKELRPLLQVLEWTSSLSLCFDSRAKPFLALLNRPWHIKCQVIHSLVCHERHSTSQNCSVLLYALSTQGALAEVLLERLPLINRQFAGQIVQTKVIIQVLWTHWNVLFDWSLVLCWAAWFGPGLLPSNTIRLRRWMPR